MSNIDKLIADFTDNDTDAARLAAIDALVEYEATEYVDCPACGGTGETGDYYFDDFGGNVTDNIERCSKCGGTGRVLQ